MALAAMAPLLLYQIYVWTDRVGNLRIVSYAAYLAYWVGQFMVLLLNRTREYGADHFSAKVTHAPGALSSALVKIGYGIVRERSEARRFAQQGDSGEKKSARRAQQLGQALGLMGIASASGGEALALGTASPEEAARVMRWDLVNPWARFYELSSTHPLTAMRVRALNREAEAQHQGTAYPMPENARLRWTGFGTEFLLWIAPLACAFVLISWFWIGESLQKVGIHTPPYFLPSVLIALGVAWAARIGFRYRGNFNRTQVRELLEALDISEMRPRAVQLEGEVIGHGLPGAFWSPDLVLRDETGLIFLLYRSSIPFGRFLFAICSADRLIGERVQVWGWCRRGLRPYVEVARVEARVSKARDTGQIDTLFGHKASSSETEYEHLVERTYSRWIQLAFAAACSAAGLIWLMRVLGA